MPKVELDARDRAILDALQEDARLSFAALARRVGLSPPAVAERVRRLEAEGVIRGYGLRRIIEDLGAFGSTRTSVALRPPLIKTRFPLAERPGGSGA